MQMDKASPVKRVVGSDHFKRVPALFTLGALRVAVRAAFVDVRAGILEVALEFFGGVDRVCGGFPGPADVAVEVDTFEIALTG